MAKKIILTAAFFLTLAVILGALGAHSLKGKISPENLDSFKTGVTYHFYHSLALIILAVLIEVFKKPALKIAAILFVIGIICFSGSIYLLNTMENVSFLGPVTPIGGLFFIAGWITTFIIFLKKS
jgi:uncharacterized membrane protein YgdD (TMEM256/DUF423 family)